jgi:hypothetical protein
MTKEAAVAQIVTQRLATAASRAGHQRPGAPWIGGDFQGVVVGGEVTRGRVVERLDAAAVVLDVVGGPADPEFFAAGGQFPDQVGQVAVVGVAARFGAQAAH